MHGLGIAYQRPGQGAPLETVRAEIRAVWSGNTTHAHAAFRARNPHRSRSEGSARRFSPSGALQPAVILVPRARDGRLA